MHQTFYIDIDEEITSIVEKLKKAQASEIIMVVPRHALLIQSIVNLKILKKEADDAGLQLMIVTQDKLGKILVEKAGILVQQKVDNISSEEVELSGGERKIGSQGYDLEEDELGMQKKEDRLRSIGSNEYLNEGKRAEKEREILEKNKKILVKNTTDEDSEEVEDVVNKELVGNISEEINKEQAVNVSGKVNKKILVDNFDENEKRDINRERNFPASLVDLKTKLPKDETRAVNIYSDNEKEKVQNKRIESFFFQKDDLQEKRIQKPKQKKDLKEYNLSKGSHKFFWIFGVVTLFIIVSVGGYIFLPKVELKLITKMEEKTVDSEIIASTSSSSLDYDEKIIPAELVTIEEDLVKTFNSTGDKAVSNQKARGKITIYNEFSTVSQPLVATTRFLTEDGKLFRLVKGVTIPGMEKVDGEMKSGTIEADVVADSAGSEFNIGPATFSIPGFKSSGGDKYIKFYGKSEQDMTGGGDGGEKISSVTEEDIESAKSSFNEALSDFIRDKIEEKYDKSVIIFDEAIKNEETTLNVSNNAEDVVESFNVTAKVKAQSLVVKKENFEDMLGYMLIKSEEEGYVFDKSSLSFDFGKIKSDFEIGTVNIKFKASGKMNPKVDLDEIKKGVLGKNEENLKSYLSDFKDIKQIELDHWPSFISSRIPFLENRVSVILDKQ